MNKTGWKRWIALVLAAVLVLSLVGCSGSGSASTGSTSTGGSSLSSGGAGSASDKTESETPESAGSEAAEDPGTEHMTIGVAVWGVGDMIVEGTDEVRDAVYEKFNIEIEPYAVTWGDYTEKIQLWAATNQLPDLTAYDAAYTDTFRKWRDQGVIRALPDNWADFKNIAVLLDNPEGRAMNDLSESDPNPVFYSIPRPNYKGDEDGITDYGIAIRRDWMENVGVTEVPQTPEELLELLKKFVTDDPNQSGKDDTVGLAGFTYSWMSVLLGGECPEAVLGFDWSFADDGSLIPSFMTEEFLDGMKLMKKFYDAGVIDPDYIIYKGEEGRDKFLNGQAGAYAHSGPTYGGTGIMAERFAEAFPDKELDEIVAFVPLFANSKTGETCFSAPSKYWSETYLSSQMDDAKAQRCMELMDYLLGIEGFEGVALGVKDVSYTVNEDGRYELIPLQKDDGTSQTISERWPFTGITSLAYWSPYRADISPGAADGQVRLYEDYIDMMFNEKHAKVSKAPNTNGLILTDSIDYDVATSHYEEILNRLMTSSDIEAEWHALVDEYMSQGYDEVIREMNQLYQDAGRGE